MFIWCSIFLIGQYDVEDDYITNFAALYSTILLLMLLSHFLFADQGADCC